MLTRSFSSIFVSLSSRKDFCVCTSIYVVENNNIFSGTKTYLQLPKKVIQKTNKKENYLWLGIKKELKMVPKYFYIFCKI